ncbi:CBF/Mak21 family-domain-containing protein [Gorgonomyces haynaldii]|nr:CBF/Mak21 family-domain-containing protein [Gorgonomyces haynaldii]
MKQELKLDPKQSRVIEVDDFSDSDSKDKAADKSTDRKESAKEDKDRKEAERKELAKTLKELPEEDEEEDALLKFGNDSEDQVKNLMANMLQGKQEAKPKDLIVDVGELWYHQTLAQLESKKPTQQQAQKALDQAKTLWERDVNIFEKFRESKSKANKDFVSTILKSGTVTDKVSALTLLVQESPVHSFQHLNDHLIQGMAKKKSRREQLMAIDSIKDLMLNTILPDRKLKYFIDQPFLSPKTSPKHLVLWYFEDALKKAYFDFITTLEELSKDALPHVKSKAMSVIHELLVSKPEQEANLLTLLVNKLGDLDRKTASKASFLITQLLQVHPAMSLIVIKEVERLVLRPNVTDRAIYYGIIFLNQIVLSQANFETANHLIQLYFKLFQAMVDKLSAKEPEKKEKKKRKRDENKKDKIVEVDAVNSKMMAGLLTGVNRAFPYCKIEKQEFEKHMNTLFTICHIAQFNTSIQALMLIFHVQSTSDDEASDRFYRTLYETLFDGRLYSASKQAMYLNLIFKALKADSSIARVQSFVKRLLQTVSNAHVPLVCGALFLLSELFTLKTGLWSMITQAEEDDSGYDPRKRDPRFSNANKTCLWELLTFANHFHPTVCHYARTMLSGKPIQVPENATNYDPMQNHTLSRFLDRFVYKAPKKVKSVYHGSSLMQPRPSAKLGNTLVSGGRKRNVVVEDEDLQTQQMDDQPVNQRAWDSVPLDEQFYFNFFQAKGKKAPKPKPTDEESADEEEVWDAMQNSKGFDSNLLGDVDDDLEMEDLSDDDLAMDDIDMDDLAAGEDLSDDDDLEDLDEDDIDMDDLAAGEDLSEDDGDLDALQEHEIDDEEDDNLDALEGEDSDQELAHMFQDEESEDEQPKKKKKPSRTIQKMAAIAQLHGYKGNVNLDLSSAFASADDLQDLINLDEPKKKKQRRK